MIHSSPTEHLSPTQLQALNRLKTGLPVEVNSISINGLIELFNLLITETGITISCNPHTYTHLQNYKSRHSEQATKQNLENLTKAYRNAVSQLQAKYNFSYPKERIALRHQFINMLDSYGLNLNQEFQIDKRLENVENLLSYDTNELLTLLSNHKRTWDRYSLIDPMSSIYYTDDSYDIPLLHDLDHWIKEVETILLDIQKGLNEIIDEEKHRILDIKKQLSQHLVNYQHNQSKVELAGMRQKLGFLSADLPKENTSDIPSLVSYALSNWDDVTATYLSRYSRRFNSRNHQSVIIYEAMQELRAVLRDIDQSGLIKVDLSNNPLSYETQLVQVSELLNQLHYCKYWISDETEYIPWKRFYDTTTDEQRVNLDILSTIEKSQLAKQLNYLEIRKWKEDVLRKGVPTADDSMTLFEAFKEVNEIIDWSNVNLKSVATSKVDFYLAFDGVHYILSNTLEAKGKMSFTLDDKSLDNIRPMVTLDYYNQSKQANQLSQAIIATQATIKIYQTKTLNIISCLDEIDTIEMIQVLADSKVNELKGETLSDLIKGSILAEGKEKILLIYDDILNVYQSDHYIWQRLVVQSMSSAGYKVISINTEDTINQHGLSKLLSPFIQLSSNLYKQNTL